MTIGERIKAVRLQAGPGGTKLTLEKFGERISMTNQAISSMEFGRSNPSNAAIDLICREFNINKEWLLTGEGEMHLSESRYDAIAKLTRQYLQDDDEGYVRMLINALARLDQDDWKVVSKFIDSLKK